jgi:hypothetical protein
VFIGELDILGRSLAFISAVIIMLIRSVCACSCTFALFFLGTGCGSPTAKVSGKVSCSGKGVPGSVLFSPVEKEATPGPATSVPVKEDGTFQAVLPTIGKHRLVVQPRDIKYPAPPGQEFPCSLKPTIHDIKEGSNDLSIDLSASAKN